MMSDFPEWLEEFRLADRLLDKAYEEVSPQLRSLLKTGIALAHFHFGSADSLSIKERANRHLGFREQESSRPADWAFLIFSEEQKAAARICAAAILPALGDVSRIAAIHIGRDPSPALLTSLLLCGSDEIYTLARDTCADLIQKLAHDPSGRFCLVHDGCLNDLAMQARLSSAAVLSLDREPRLLFPDSCKFDREVQIFCLGRLPAASPGAEMVWDCIYGDCNLPGLVSRLRLPPDCMGFWLFEEATPEFYQIRQTTLAGLGRRNEAIFWRSDYLDTKNQNNS